MTDIGGRLRRAREQRGLSLHDAAHQTKLSMGVLQAIERNDFTSLPGGMFRKAYLRTLAVEVGLDPNEIAADYCARFEPPDEHPAIPDREAARHREWIKELNPSPWRSIVTLLALAAAVAWFMLHRAPVTPEAPPEDSASESVAAPAPRPD